MLLSSPWVPSAEVLPGRAAIEKHDLHIKSFTNYRCEFFYVEGVANTLEEAKSGNYMEERRCTIHIHQLDDWYRYDLFGVAHSEQMKNNNGQSLPSNSDRGNVGIDDFKNETYITNGTADFVTKRNSYASFFPAERRWESRGSNPLTSPFGLDRLLRLPTKWLSDSNECQMIDLGIHNVLGKEVHRIQLDENQKKWRRTFLLDPNSGYLALHILDEGTNEKYRDNQHRSEFFVRDVRKLDDQHFFPTRTISVLHAKTKFLVREIIVNRIELNCCRPSDFDYITTQHQEGLFQGDALWDFTLTPGTTINPKTISELIKIGNTQHELKQKRAVQTKRIRLFWLIGIGILSIVIIAMVINRRQAKKKAVV